MGCKTFKQHFDIGHIVHYSEHDGEKMLYISSPMITGIIKIRMNGTIYSDDGIGINSLERIRGKLKAAGAGKIRELIEMEDEFSGLQVCYYVTDKYHIEQQHYEKFGWPYITAEGYLMHENTHYKEYKTAVIQALTSALSMEERIGEIVAEKYAEIQEIEEKLKQYSEIVKSLKTKLHEIKAN